MVEVCECRCQSRCGVVLFWVISATFESGLRPVLSRLFPLHLLPPLTIRKNSRHSSLYSVCLVCLLVPVFSPPTQVPFHLPPLIPLDAFFAPSPSHPPEREPPRFLKRLRRDYQQLVDTLQHVCFVHVPGGDDPLTWRMDLLGPPETPYEWCGQFSVSFSSSLSLKAVSRMTGRE